MQEKNGFFEKSSSSSLLLCKNLWQQGLNIYPTLYQLYIIFDFVDSILLFWTSSS